MRFLILFMLFFFMGEIAYAQEHKIIIETRILSPDPQPGMKSKHTIIVDFINNSVKDKFETGTTEVFGITLSSARDNFAVDAIQFAGENVSFTVKGSTASGILISPDIDYKFEFVVNKDTGVTSVKGCHDAYPAYSIFNDVAKIYEFKHRSVDLLSLFGSCDVIL